MKFIKLSIILDTFFGFLLTLLITFAVIFRKIKRVYFRFSVCLLTSFIIAFIILFVLIRKEMKKQKEQQESILDDKYLYSLSVMPKKEIVEFFKFLFEKANISVISRSNYLIIAKDYYVYPLFLFEDVTATAIIEIFNKLPNKRVKLVIFANTFSSSATEISQKFKERIILMGKLATLSLMKKYEVFPKIDDSPIIENKKWKLLIDNLKIKKTAKRFLYSGCVLLILSLITFYPLYYIVLGSISLILSAIIFLFGQKPKRKENFNLLPFLN